MLLGAESAVELLFGLLIAGVVAGVVFSSWPRLCGWLCALFVAGAAGLSAWLGWLVFGGVSVDLTFAETATASLSIHLTRLNLIFIWLVLGIGLLATVYSVRYVDRCAAYEVPALPVLRYYPVLMLFLASMTAVICISDLLFFFIAWSIMSLSGLALILHEYHKPEVLYAGIKFAIFTLVGNLCILAAILLLYRAGGHFSYETAVGTMGTFLATQPWMAHLIFGLFAIGFLTKLGIYPMGDWLPDAHPAAPSPVSALLSGVMIKLAAYDMAHTSMEMLVGGGAGRAELMTWGMLLAVFGAASVLLGGSAAAVQIDTKRLLAYSSVSQSGYILMCLGVSMAFVLVDTGLAALAFVAAMVFVIADGMHKSLLFLTAGSILHATGTRDLMKLGGLGERMPSTTLAAIAGGLSLGGIPLTAGFIAKWMLLQAALLGATAQPLLAVFALVIVMGSILGIAYALKYVGAAYLGAPASPECCEAAQEVPLSMRMPQMVLVAGLIAAGLWPLIMAGPAVAAWGEMTGIAQPMTGLDSGMLMVFGEPGLVGGFVPLIVFMLMAIAGLLAVALSRIAGAPVREVPSWQSGLDLPLAVTRLPASGWYWPFTPVLKRAYREINLPFLAGLREAAEAERKAESSQASDRMRQASSQ